MASGADETPPGQQDDTSVVVDPTGSPRPLVPSPLVPSPYPIAAGLRCRVDTDVVVGMGLETDSKFEFYSSNDAARPSS